MHYLAIAAKKELLPYLPIDWPKTELTELVNPASLAAVVIDEKDSRSRGIYQTMKEKLVKVISLKSLAVKSTEIAFCFSLTIEFLQLFLRLGTFQLSDLCYNTLGGCLGGIAYWIAWKIRHSVR